jgi:type II secretion system protein C
LEERKVAAIGAGGVSESGRSAPPGGYQLVGTVIGPGPYSWAILQEGADRKQRIVRFHGNIDDAKIVQISRKRILIERQGKEEAISFSEAEVRPRAATSPPAPRSPKGEVVQRLSANRFLVNREDVTAAVGNVNQFMTQARFKPHFVMGRPSGFSVSEIQPGSLMEKIGLQNNDVVKKVNGQLITSPEEVFKAYSQLQRDSNIEVEVERGTRSEVFRYEIR